MNKRFILPLVAAATLILNGCALVRTTNVEKINDISHKESTEIHAYGGEHTVILGSGFFKQEGACSEVDFLRFITGKYPEAQDVIRVRMEHHKDTKAGKVTEYCKYSGIAIAYKDLSIEETAKWKALYESSPAKDSSSAAVKFAPVTANVQFVPANGSDVPAVAVEAAPAENNQPVDFLSRQ